MWNENVLLSSLKHFGLTAAQDCRTSYCSWRCIHKKVYINGFSHCCAYKGTGISHVNEMTAFFSALKCVLACDTGKHFVRSFLMHPHESCRRTCTMLAGFSKTRLQQTKLLGQIQKIKSVALNMTVAGKWNNLDTLPVSPNWGLSNLGSTVFESAPNVQHSKTNF